MLVVDAHSHIFPAELMDAMAGVRLSSEIEDLRRTPYLYDWDARIRYMDAQGIDTQVLVLARPPMWIDLDQEQVHELTRVANDSIARVVAAHPGRFVGIGVLPRVDEFMLGEFERIHTELGLVGVELHTNVDGEPIDAEHMWPLFEAIDRIGLPIWIHPQDGPTHHWMAANRLNRLFYWPFETSAAMARLVYGGVLKRHPNLRIVTHHLGGMVPFYGARIETFAKMDSPDRSTLADRANGNGVPGDILEGFRKFYADTAVSGSTAALRCALEFFGIGHVLFGTDFPFGGEQVSADIIRSIHEIDLPEEARDAVFGGNAMKLLGLQ